MKFVLCPEDWQAQCGERGIVYPLLSYFPSAFGKQLENILHAPLNVLGTALLHCCKEGNSEANNL